MVSMVDFRINWMPNYLKKWNIETFANNLTNVKKIQFTKIDATQQSQQLTFLQPLHVGVSLTRSF
ncbi:hypothetical protein QE357_000822 [Siphonobacter sp. BAB-5404]|nr:hypothetical protein [Siphonobacter sp. SORGH_AS_0500]